MARSWGKRVGALGISVVLAAGGAFGAGCGEEEPPDPVLERGPAPPEGAIVATPATLRAGDEYTNLASAVNRATGTGDALIVGLAIVKRGTPQLRITVDGDPVPSDTQSFSGEGGEVAAVYCSCELTVDDSDIEFEGRSRQGGVVGARSLTVFTPAKTEEISGGDLVDAVGVTTERVGVNPSGSVLADTTVQSDADQVLLLSSFRSPQATSASPQAIRTEALLNGEAMAEIASANVPDGEIVIYYAEEGASAGATVELVGFTVTGSARTHVTSLAVCPCALD